MRNDCIYGRYNPSKGAIRFLLTTVSLVSLAVLHASGYDFPPGDHRRHDGIRDEVAGRDDRQGKDERDDAKVQRQQRDPTRLGQSTTRRNAQLYIQLLS